MSRIPLLATLLFLVLPWPVAGLAAAVDRPCLDCHLKSEIESISGPGLKGRRFKPPPSGCPGLESVDREIRLIQFGLMKLADLSASLDPEDPRRALLDRLALDYRLLLEAPPLSAGAFQRKASELRERMDCELLAPYLVRSRRMRLWAGLLIILGIGLFSMAVRWIGLRSRSQSREDEFDEKRNFSRQTKFPY